MDWQLWIWWLNAILAGVVIGLCLFKAHWRRLVAARDARVAGLCIVSIVIALGSHDLRNTELSPRHYLLTIGLILCCYGMSRTAPGERDHLD